MIDYNEIISIPPFSLGAKEKEELLTKTLKELTIMHYGNCNEYRKILDSLSFNPEKIDSYYDIPYLPVRMFKEYSLKSIPDDQIAKTMTSSGTTGQQVSKIYIDRITSINQTKVLTKIVSSYIGHKRVPMIIIDTSALLKNREMFSARGAGILGFSIFASDKIYALDENMNLNIDLLKLFLEKHQGETILLFGFTFMIWQHFYGQLVKSGYSPDLSKGIMIHGGGWKKLASEAVSSEKFKESLKEVCNIDKVFNYYGMVEQTGSIYMECECGHLHTSIFSDVIIRRPRDFSVANVEEKGLIEVVSILPYSYPGHVLLTEDEGVILGEDNCPCGRKGKYFKVIGRVRNAEIRGCSDTYAAKFK
jgi:Coenzyme F390 synthetase